MLGRVPYFFLIMGGCTTFLSVLGLMMMFEKTTDTDKDLLINEEENNNVEQYNQNKFIDESELKPVLTLREVFKIRDLWILIFVMNFGGTSIGIYSSNFKAKKNLFYRKVLSI